MQEMAINMESVELGRTKNHLIFKGYVPRISTFYMYEFDYTGVELTTTAVLTDQQRQRLLDELIKDYGYAPFDEKKAKDILGDFEQYIIEV